MIYPLFLIRTCIILLPPEYDFFLLKSHCFGIGRNHKKLVRYWNINRISPLNMLMIAYLSLYRAEEVSRPTSLLFLIAFTLENPIFVISVS